jgi:transposase
MKDFLSPVERNKLKLQHKHERDKRVCDRIKAVLLADEGWTSQQIAKVLLLSDEAISQQIRDYLTSQKLKPENGGSVSKLNIEQTTSLLVHLQNHTYLYTKDIIVYVKATFDIAYTVPGMTSWLKINGFSYKKPAVVPGKANREAQEQWIKEYEKLKKNLSENETICFIDGVHPTHIHKLVQELVFGKEKAPAIQRSKMTPYYNIGSFLIVESRGFLKAKIPILELVCV